MLSSSNAMPIVNPERGNKTLSQHLQRELKRIRGCSQRDGRVNRKRSAVRFCTRRRRFILRSAAQVGWHATVLWTSVPIVVPRLIRSRRETPSP
jgi:hypothetical protein